MKITAKNITPLCQIEESATINGVPTVKIKRKFENLNGEVVSYPYYSGNGFRGLMHREVANIVLMKAVEKGIKIEAKDFHIISAGGGSNFQSQELKVENEVRALNPVVSLFGASLAIEGKLMITDLDPVNKGYITPKEDKPYSSLIKTFNFIKKDDFAKGQVSKYGRILSEDDIIAYQDENELVQTQRDEQRNDNDNSEPKIRKFGIQAYNAKEFIIPGTTFECFIGEKYPLTLEERGALIVALEKALTKQLGSTQNLGFGAMEYKVQIEEDNTLRDLMGVEKNSKNLFAPKLERFAYSEYDKQCVEAFNNWLENIKPENIAISKAMVETQPKEKAEKKKK